LELVSEEVLDPGGYRGHPPFPTGSKQFSGNFGNLLFLAVFNFRGHFEALNDIFGKMGRNMEVPSILPPK
jgi:hypothetical protein